MAHLKERYINNYIRLARPSREANLHLSMSHQTLSLQVAFMDEIWHTIPREHSCLKCTHLVPDIVMCFWNVLISIFSTRFGSIGLIESCSQPCLSCVHAQSGLFRREV